MRSGVDNQEVFSYQSFTVPGQESSETASSHDPLPGTNDIVVSTMLMPAFCTACHMIVACFVHTLHGCT